MSLRPPVIAILGDIVRSRRMSDDERGDIQHVLDQLMADINERHSSSVLGDFLMTLGDEFQGMLDSATPIPDIVQDLREKLPRTKFRIVASWGRVTTALKPSALGTDGPAWHAARDLLSSWRKTKRDGVAFTGFGDDDVVLNGISAMLTYHWSHLEASQRDIINALRHHEGTRKDAASEIGVSQQALSNRALTAGWREYDAGMTAWRTVLGRHVPKLTSP